MSEEPVTSADAAIPAEWRHDIPVTARPGMRVPARVFADSVLWEQIGGDHSLAQLLNVATLPGVEGMVYGMPDMHLGYGFPVGGVAGMRADDGVISPGGVGYDINCGVRLLASNLTRREVLPRLEALVHELSRSVPSGAGKTGTLSLREDELDAVLAHGSAALVERGYASAEDLRHTESGGSLPEADPAAVSERARERGRNQLGTLGSGNHFLEVEAVDEVFEPHSASALGLERDGVVVLIHSGSRGMGHQVCTDYVRLMDRVMPKYGITLPDRELACAPFGSPEGRQYFGAMCASANFAWANRQMIAHRCRETFERVTGRGTSLTLVYDVAHNIAKLEQHGGALLCVHRKGATRAFGPGHPETPDSYRSVGQPVFIPGSMGTASYVLAGTDAALAASLGSTCHGAGRRMSRHAAIRSRPGHAVRQELERKGIVIRCPSNREVAEEGPHAYKDVERVVEVVARAGLARKIARLVPMGVVKG